MEISANTLKDLVTLTESPISCSQSHLCIGCDWELGEAQRILVSLRDKAVEEENASE